MKKIAGQLYMSFQNWQEYINPQKAVLPQLWKTLKSTGQGNAAIIFPSLLPFISQIPENALCEKFYQRFLDNFKQG